MKKLASLLAIFACSLCLVQAEDKPAGPPPEGGPGRPGGPGGPGKGRPSPEKMIEHLDTDKDGSISEDEFKAGPRAKENPERAMEMFKKIDADKDGKLTLDEIKKAPRPEGPPRGEGGKGGKGGPGGPGGPGGKGERKGPPPADK